MVLIGPKAERLYCSGLASLHARVSAHHRDEDANGELVAKTSLKDTTVGRAILWMIVPKVCLTPSSTRRWVKKQSPKC